MNKINVMVLGIGGNTSLGILKALKKSQLSLRIYGACINTDNVGHLLVDSFFLSPFANSIAFIPWLIKICQDNKIDIVFTGVEEILISISINLEEIKKSISTKFIVSSPKHLNIAQNKLKTVEWLKNNGFNYPMFCNPSSKKELLEFTGKNNLPYILKPIFGKSSNGIELIYDLKSFESIININDYVLQELIGKSEDEYTVGCYIGKDGFVFDPIIMRRRLQNGSSVYVEVVENIDIKIYCKNICHKFGSIGPMNIQLRLNKDSQPVCFEINLRYSGTTPIRAEFGFNDVEAAIKEYVLESKIEDIFNIQYGYSIRYLNEIYIKNINYNNQKKNIRMENMGLIDENINNGF